MNKKLKRRKIHKRSVFYNLWSVILMLTFFAKRKMLEAKKIFIYPVLVLLLLTGFAFFSASRGKNYSDLSGLFKNAFFFDKGKAYLGYANQIFVINLKKGVVKKKYDIFETALAYQTYPRALFVYKNNVFFRTYIRESQNINNDCLFWYNIKEKKVIKKIDINGPPNIIHLKNKNFIVCGDRLINISEEKIYQITSLSLDEQKAKQFKRLYSRWSNWITDPDGRCYTLLSVYDLAHPNKSVFATKLYQYNFYDISYKRKSLSDYGVPYSLDYKHDSMGFVKSNIIYIVVSDGRSGGINVYNVAKGKVEAKIPLNFFGPIGDLIIGKGKHVYYCSLDYSDDGINYSPSYAQTNVYQRINISIINTWSNKVSKSFSKVFHNEPFNRVSFFCINKGILYLIQDIGLGNDKKLIAIDLLSQKKIAEKVFDFNFVPQIMTPKDKIIGFENGEVDKVKVVEK